MLRNASSNLRQYFGGDPSKKRRILRIHSAFLFFGYLATTIFFNRLEVPWFSYVMITNLMYISVVVIIIFHIAIIKIVFKKKRAAKKKSKMLELVKLLSK